MAKKQKKIEPAWSRPCSTAINKYWCNEKAGMVIVRFAYAGTYLYAGVPAKMIGAFHRSRSKGRYLNKYIKGVSQCLNLQ